MPYSICLGQNTSALLLVYFLTEGLYQKKARAFQGRYVPYKACLMVGTPFVVDMLFVVFLEATVFQIRFFF